MTIPAWIETERFSDLGFLWSGGERVRALAISGLAVIHLPAGCGHGLSVRGTGRPAGRFRRRPGRKANVMRLAVVSQRISWLEVRGCRPETKSVEGSTNCS